MDVLAKLVTIQHGLLNQISEGFCQKLNLPVDTECLAEKLFVACVELTSVSPIFNMYLEVVEKLKQAHSEILYVKKTMSYL